MEYIKGGKSVRLQVYCETKNAAERIAGQFGGSVREMKNSDWQGRHELPKPLKVRDIFLVTGEDRAEELEKLRKAHAKRHVIVIPPEMAFGTGDHATTATCLRFLVDLSRERRNTEWRLADLGTGSGLLAIAAAKLGAAEVWGCDFDPLAISVARQNLERNETPAVVLEEADVLKWQPKEKFDVVVANLFSTVLLDAWPLIAGGLAPKGDLVVSGILASQAWEVFEGAAKVGLGFPKVVKKGKWVTAKGGWFNDLNGR